MRPEAAQNKENKMQNKIYAVEAHRAYGEYHCYIVGVFTSKEKAIKEADIEADFRGGKYYAEVIELQINKNDMQNKQSVIYSNKQKSL